MTTRTTLRNYISIITLAFALSACTGEDNEDNSTMTSTDKPLHANTDDSAQPQPAEELIAQPVTQSGVKEDGNEKEMTLTGSIIYKDLEGGFFAFIAQNGDKYTLHGLEETYQKNGLIVEITGVAKPDIMTFTQFGTVLQVTQVNVLDTSKVIGSLPTK